MGSQPHLTSPRTGYIASLDGWRTVAIAAVIFYHLHLVPAAHPFWFELQKMGEEGVKLFFAISGVLICTRLLDEEQRNGRISLRSFYLRRLFRIQPAAMVYLLVLAGLALAGWLAVDRVAWLSALLSFRNWTSNAHGPGVASTAHFWSLAVEEHFYLLVPGLICLVPSRRRAAVFGVLAGVSVLAYEWVNRRPATHPAYFSELELAWLLLPAAMAMAMRSAATRRRVARWLPADGMTLVVGLIVVGMCLRWRHIGHLLDPSLTLLVVASALHVRSGTTRLLELAPMRFLGRISYSIYLWQQLFCFWAKGFPVSPGALGWLQHFPQNIAATLACAMASYYWVERPLIKVGHRLAARYGQRTEDVQALEAARAQGAEQVLKTA